MKTSFKDYTLGMIRSSGMKIDDVCALAGISKPTLYRRLSDPDRIDRQTIRMLHKHCGMSYEELIERK